MPDFNDRLKHLKKTKTYKKLRGSTGVLELMQVTKYRDGREISWHSRHP